MKKLISFNGVLIPMLLFLFGCTTITAQAASKEYQDAVAEYLEVTNTKETTIITVSQAYKNMNLPIDDIDAVSMEIINTLWSDYVVDVANVFEQYYTLSEIREITKFYNTPLGKKFAKYSPIAAEQTSKIMMGQEYLSTIQSILMKHIK